MSTLVSYEYVQVGKKRDIPTQYPSGRTPDSLMDCGIGISSIDPFLSFHHMVFKFAIAIWTWSSAIKLARVKGTSGIGVFTLWMWGSGKRRLTLIINKCVVELIFANSDHAMISTCRCVMATHLSPVTVCYYITEKSRVRRGAIP